MEHALPRVRAKTKQKRKKRKPPGPWFYWMIGWALLFAVAIFGNVIDIAVHGPFWVYHPSIIELPVIVNLAINSAFFTFYYPRALEEWKKWKRENEDD